MKRFSRLYKLTKPVKESEAYYEINSIAWIYKNYVRYYKPHSPITKLKPGMEARNKKVLKYGRPIAPEDNLSRSVRRSKRRIKDLVDCNDFELFVTFTFDKSKVNSRYDSDALKALMTNWLKETQKRIGKFNYLMVMEYHKDGAIHFHALLGGYPATRLIDSGHLDHRGNKTYNLVDYPFGFSKAEKIADIAGAHKYLTKYIVKDMPYFKGKRRFNTSHELKKPPRIENPTQEFGSLLVEPYESLNGVTTLHEKANLHIQPTAKPKASIASVKQDDMLESCFFGGLYDLLGGPEDEE